MSVLQYKKSFFYILYIYLIIYIVFATSTHSESIYIIIAANECFCRVVVSLHMEFLFVGFVEYGWICPSLRSHTCLVFVVVVVVWLFSCSYLFEYLHCRLFFWLDVYVWMYVWVMCVVRTVRMCLKADCDSGIKFNSTCGTCFVTFIIIMLLYYNYYWMLEWYTLRHFASENNIIIAHCWWACIWTKFYHICSIYQTINRKTISAHLWMFV